jgi:hypothetical protein
MENDVNLSPYRFLIIAGTSKAGTTSVFNYLADHPQICPAEKETRFFLDADYPLPSKKRYQKNGPETYLSFFDSGPQENSRFEATPDYLYSEHTPHVIHQTLASVRFIFILREPVSRLLSWYRFGRKRPEIGLKMTFDEYVAIQRGNGENVAAKRRHPAFYALQHGRYSAYLKPYLELFGKTLIHIAFYEELQRDPLVFITSICRSAGIDDTYFQGYRFDVANKGSDVRSPYLHKAYIESQGRIRKLVRYTPALRFLLQQLRPRVDAMYEKMNVTKKELTMSAPTQEFLLSYYRDEPTRLREMFGVEVPWLSNPRATSSGVEINLSEHRAE